MNRPKYTYSLTLAFLVLASVFFFIISRHPSGPRQGNVINADITETESTARVIHSAPHLNKSDYSVENHALPDNSHQPSIQDDPSLHILLSKQFAPPASEVSSPGLENVIRRVLSEAWLDPEDKAIRRRIRVVEANFKYPMLRIEEEISWNPDTSRFEGVLSSASVADHLMVKPTTGQDLQAVVESLEQQGFQIRRAETNEMLLVEIPNSDDAVAQMDAIERLGALDEFIDYAEPDFLVFPCATPNDPLYQAGSLWSLENNQESVNSLPDADIDAEGGWSVRNSASGITVAVLDTGVRYTHEDLANRMWQDTSGNFGWDAYDEDSDPMDTNGHGTHCAGIIGAQGNNGLGITGVAWDVNLMAVRFIGEFGGTTSDAIQSINYARLNGADIISASWGGSGYSRGLLAAIFACYEANIPVVTAAGNERWDIDAKPQYPASYPTPNIVSVAATSRDDTLTTFSNYGYTAIDLAAPGENILSCGIGSDSDYQFLSGTSAATPHVAGALALAKAEFGSEPVDDLVVRLLRSVDRLDSLEGKVAMEGRLNLHQLLLSSSSGLDHDFFNSPYVFKYCKGYWCRLNYSLTREPDEDIYSPNTGRRSAWFQWTAPGPGLLRFNGSMSVEDVSVVAFEGTIRNELRRIKDNFAMRPTKSSDLLFYVEKNKTYTFSVDSRSSISQIIAASFSFSPGNDMVSQAIQISGSESFNVGGTNCSATIEPFEKSLPHQNLVQQASVWWKWTPPESGEYVISTLGSNFDTVLGVYQRNSGNFQTIGVNDSRSPTDDTSRLELNLNGGQEYYIVVASYHKDTVGDILLSGFPKKQIRFLQEPKSQLARWGDSFELSVVTDTTSEATYQWYGPQGPLSGVGNQSRIQIPAAGSDDMGDYYVVVKDGETTGQSATATITQLALPPRFLFSPQDISVLDGTDIQMFAKADGLQPVTLRWFKEGVEMQTGHLHTIASSSPTDSGIYYVEASNAIGTTRSHPFQILVSTDTFGPLTYRSPGIPSASKIKFVNGRHMAFGNDGRLIISANGINWENPALPEPMDINDIAYDATLGLYVIVGEERSSSNAASAVSLNGRNWTINPAPLPDYSLLEKVVAGNGIFVGYSTWIANKVYTTTNGVDWTPREYTTVGSTNSKQLQNVVFYNGEFIGGGRGVIYRSSDGINWTENATPNDGRILVYDGKLATFNVSPVSLSTSTDGINWSAPVQCINPPSDRTRITSNGTRFYHAVSSTVASSPDGINWHHLEYEIKPTNPYSSTANFAAVSGPEGNLVALGGGGVVQGPSYTQLSSLNTDNPVQLPPITKIFGNTVYQLDDKGYTFYYSNDLRSWRSHTLSLEIEGDSLIYANGKYWALNIPTPTSTSYLMSGSSPAALTRHAAGTHDSSIKILRTWNNEVYAINDAKVFKLDVNSNWQVVYTMPKPYNQLEKIRGMKTIDRGIMIWSDYGAVYATTNGTTWAQVAYNNNAGPIVVDIQHPTLKPRYAGPSFCEFDGKAYLYVSGTNKLYVAATGFSFVEQFNLNPFSQLTAVPEGLLGIEGTTGWYSPDGTTWQQFPTHYLTNFFYHYNGSLLAWSQNGLYQAGSPASHAPTNSVANLVDYQSMTSGTTFSLDYSVLDPEDRFDRVEFYLDGVLVGQSSSAVGTNTLDINWAGEKNLEMRSYDQDGQVTRDYWTIQGLTNLPDKVVSTAAANFGTYAASVWDNRLQIGIEQELFAKFCDRWLGRSMPFSTAGVEFTFTPDAVFAVGADIGFSQNVFISENGIHWSGLNYRADSMKYQDGWLLAKNFRQMGSGQTSNLAVSRDGIAWREVSTGNLGAAAGNGFIVGLYGTGFGLSTVKVSSDGVTWAEYPGIDMHDLVFDSGFFCGTGNTTFLRSTDGKIWTDYAPTLESGEVIYNLDIAGGWYYLLTTRYMWISEDNGTTWTKVANAPSGASRVSYGNGLWFCAASGGIYSSTDGINWVTSSGSVDFYTHEDGLSRLLNSGIWTTNDGLEWTQTEAPQPDVSPSLLSEPWTLGASTQFSILQNKILISLDGADWKQCPLTLTGGKIPKQIAIHNGNLMVYAKKSSGSTETDLWQSSDGVNFTQVPLNAVYNFETVKHDGVRFFAKGWMVGSPNTFFTSTDGANWTATTPPGSGTIELLNQTLIVIAPRVAGNPGYQNIYFSADGFSWQTRTLSSGMLTSLCYGNGIFLASQSNTLWTGASIDSLVPLASSVSPYQGNLSFADGSFYLMTPNGIWKSTLGQSWEQLYSATSGSLEVIADTVYIKDSTSLRPVLAADLQVTAVNGTPSNMAVGANLNASVSLKNVGLKPITAGTNLQIKGALSRDGLFENDDDVFVGTVNAVISSELVVGDSTDINLLFKVPGLRAGGEFSLVLIVEADIPEMTRANNTAMTEGSIVTVDEFVLNVIRNGEGAVNQDFSSLRYANGTLVTLNANVAKGSSFGGWTGANVSPLSQITLMMNQDQNLTAKFLPTATLQLSIQGSGTVDGWADPGTYPVGNAASLTAQPNVGWEFAGWAGGSTSTNASINLTVTQNTNLTAIFRQTLNSWKGVHFTASELADPLISSDLADADLDGVSNWREYLHGSNPKDLRSKGVMQTGIDGGFLQMIYTRNQGAEAPYALTCGGSRDLTDWTDPELEQRILSVSDGIETIEARMPATGLGKQRGFLKMEYERP